MTRRLRAVYQSLLGAGYFVQVRGVREVFHRPESVQVLVGPKDLAGMVARHAV